MHYLPGVHDSGQSFGCTKSLKYACTLSLKDSYTVKNGEFVEMFKFNTPLGVVPV